jgi:hypothetical protein
MFMSSIRRWRSGLIAAVRIDSSIGRLRCCETPPPDRHEPDYAERGEGDVRPIPEPIIPASGKHNRKHKPDDHHHPASNL